MNRMSIYKGVRRRRIVIGMFSILMIVLLVAAACGEEATPTPVPATSTPVPPTATPAPAGETPVPATATPLPPGVTPPAATATPVSAATATPAPTTGLRPMSEWTVENPATLAEIEAELENYRGESFVFTSWGGAYQEAQRRAYLIPFQEQFGIEVIEDSPMSYGKARAMVEAGNLQWNVVDYGGQAGWQAALTGVLEELDFSIIDDRDFLEIGRSPYFGGGGITWSNVVAYSTVTWPDPETAPKTMADIFDVDRFPGRRALAGPEWSWKTSLRFALLSEDPSLLDTPEGRASLSRLSDEQVDRAFEILTEFAPHVNVWWSSGADCPSLLISGELDICTAWNGRIFDAAQEGAAVKICWTCGHMINTDDWGVLAGLKEQDPRKFELVQLFMAWTAFPERNAQVARYISYGPMNTKGVPFLEGPEWDHVRDELPSSAANIGYSILEDEKYDGSISDVMSNRWVEWQQAQ